MRSVSAHALVQGVEEVAKHVTPPPGDKEAARWRPPVLIGKDDTPPVAIPTYLLAPSARPPPAAATEGTLVQPPVAADAGSEPIPDAIKALVSRCVARVCGTQPAATVEPPQAATSLQAPLAAAAEKAAADDAAADEAAETLAAMEAALAGSPMQTPAHVDADMLPLAIKPEAAGEQAPPGELQDGSAAGVYETRHMADPELVRAAIGDAAEAWRQRALDVERVGGFRPAEVDELLDAQQQFDWGDMDPEGLTDARNKLLSAKDWYADVQVRSGRMPLLCCSCCYTCDAVAAYAQHRDCTGPGHTALDVSRRRPVRTMA